MPIRLSSLVGFLLIAFLSGCERNLGSSSFNVYFYYQTIVRSFWARQQVYLCAALLPAQKQAPSI